MEAGPLQSAHIQRAVVLPNTGSFSNAERGITSLRTRRPPDQRCYRSVTSQTSSATRQVRGINLAPRCPVGAQVRPYGPPPAVGSGPVQPPAQKPPPLAHYIYAVAEADGFRQLAAD